ncbi:type III secretion system export apparatus subunit SctS [Sphingomonas cannabina]|uniref:type III secretion system export apparatus subunit SctS n=1 Tax=Sphingomonas cannabina TaxID=2899123 RepID=UPI001F486C87|nr:type III secretion system export apparatus subunit SctS [Sphingomonas cannabina]UIJ46522.1 type III secretion system export apparatus subunit SctS [Sphingomonas cannabina]
MSDDLVRLTTEALWLVLLLSAPPIIAASVVGLLVAIVQAATQLQEQTLQYTLKFFAIVISILVTAGLMAGTLYGYADAIFSGLAGVGR